MQSLHDYPISITINNVTYLCKEVLVDDTNYSKLVTSDGDVLVLISPGYGGGWSTSCYDPSLRKQMILDSRLVQYIASKDFKEHFSKNKNSIDIINDIYFKQLISTFFSQDITKECYLDIHNFSQLCIDMVPENSQFCIVEYDGSESIEMFNPAKYITA